MQDRHAHKAIGVIFSSMAPPISLILSYSARRLIVILGRGPKFSTPIYRLALWKLRIKSICAGGGRECLLCQFGCRLHLHAAQADRRPRPVFR